MRRAWQTGRPAASGIVELVQERKARSKQAGFLIYVPVYAEPTRPAVFATARGARPIEAFVYAPFPIDNLITAVLGSQLDPVPGIAMLHGEDPAPPRGFGRGRCGAVALEERTAAATPH